MTKFCPACDQTLDIDCFGPSRGRKDGLAWHCKLCARKQVNESRARRRGAEAAQAGGTRARELSHSELRATDEQVTEGRIIAALKVRPMGWDELQRKAKADDDAMSEILLMLTDEGAVRRRGTGDDRIYSLGAR